MAIQSPSKPQTLKVQPVADRTVRLTIPLKTAYDLKSMNQVFANLADRLGHRECFSGVDCLFQIERDWVVNPQSLEIEGVHGAIG